MEADDKMGVHSDGSGGFGVSRLEVIEGSSGRRRRTKAERARIAVESMMPGGTVADVARKHGTTRWQIYDWRKQIRKGALMLPESVAALPIFAELVVDDRTADASAAVVTAPATAESPRVRSPKNKNLYFFSGVKRKYSCIIRDISKYSHSFARRCYEEGSCSWGHASST